MSGVNRDSLAVLAMASRFVDAGVPALKASEVWRLLENVEEPSSLVGLDARALADVTSGTGIEGERLARLLDVGVGLAVRLDALHERGITAVTLLDEHYPWRLRDRLGTAAPPVLYCAGELSVLGADGIGVVGSRDVAPEAAEVTRKVAHQIAAAGTALVSGGAKGVDAIGMAAAYEAGGSVVGVLADSLERAIGRSDNRRAMLDGRACLCTPYGPDAGFTAGAAMGRNKIIYGLSRVTLVVASAKGEGGTWSGASEALSKGYGRVAVWTGAGRGPGNDPLVAAGGVPVDQPEAVLELDAIEAAGAASDTQMALWFGSAPASTDAPCQQPGRAIDRSPAAETIAEGPGVEDDRCAETALVPKVFPRGALALEPTGICWCGCGKEVEGGGFFLPRHAPGAAQRAVIAHFGSVEAFLAMLGEAPSNDQT